MDHFEFSYSEFFSGRFDTSGSMVPRLVHKIEGGYPERDIGAEEEGQGWGDSRRLIVIVIMIFMRTIKHRHQNKLI